MATVDGNLDTVGTAIAVTRGTAEAESNLPRLILAAERIADALEQIARQQVSPTEKTIRPAGGDPALGFDVASMDQDSQAPSSPVTSANVPADRITNMEGQLATIYDLLKKQQKSAIATERKFYVVEEVAAATNFSKWTIRNACSKGRIKADKSPDGQWRIPHEEVVQVQNQGLPK